MISSSQFACSAAGIAPDPSLLGLAKPGAVCLLCGVAIGHNEPHESVRLGEKFTDFTSLAAPLSDVACWGCHQARKTEHGMLQIAAKALYTPNEVFKSHSRAEQAYHLYNPPEGPFLWVVSLSKAEHMVWRTPLALNTERFPVRVGPHVLIVERPRVFAALTAWRLALEAVQATDKRYAKIVQLCETLDPDLMEAGSLRLKGWVAALQLPEVVALAAAMASLSVGDAWALSVLVIFHNRFGWDVRPDVPNKLFS